MRKVLFDENMPHKLRRDFPDFAIRTAQEQGWSSFKNGQLLAVAVREFEVLVTIDQRMRYQQIFKGCRSVSSLSTREIHVLKASALTSRSCERQ